MRLSAAGLLFALSLGGVSACASFDCPTSLPASCPAPQTVPENAAAPADLVSACSACLSGAQVECLDIDGMNKQCSCYSACDSQTEE